MIDLKSQICTSSLHVDQPEISEGVDDDNLNVIKYDEIQESSVEDALEKSMESRSEKINARVQS